MPEYELYQTIAELRVHCFGAYLFGTAWGVFSLIAGIIIGFFVSYKWAK